MDRTGVSTTNVADTTWDVKYAVKYKNFHYEAIAFYGLFFYAFIAVLDTLSVYYELLVLPNQ